MSEFHFYNWEEVDINWEVLDMNWEEVGIIINDVLPYVSGSIGSNKRKINLQELNKLPEEKKRKIIKLSCEIEGNEYIDYKYVNEDVVITAKHIDIIINKLAKNIKIYVQNIS